MKPPTTVDPDDTNMRTRKPNPWYRWLIHHAIAPWWAVAGWRMVKIWNMLGDGEMRPGVIKSGWDELRYSLEFGGGYGFFSNMCRKKMVCMHFLSKTLISRTNRFAYSDGVPGSRCFFNFQFIYHYEGKQWQKSWRVSKSESVACAMPIWGKIAQLYMRGLEMFGTVLTNVLLWNIHSNLSCNTWTCDMRRLWKVKLRHEFCIVSEFTILHPSIHVLKRRNADVAVALYDIIRVYTLIAARIRKIYSCHCTTLHNIAM